MTATLTTNYNLKKPKVGGDAVDWATYLNENWDSVDALIKSIADSFSVFTDEAAGLVPAPGTLNDYFLRDDGLWSLVDVGNLARGSLDLNAFVVGSPSFNFGSEGCQRIYADFTELSDQALLYSGGQLSFVPVALVQTLYKSNDVQTVTNSVNVSIGGIGALSAAEIGDTAIRVRMGGTYENTDNTPSRTLTFAFYFNNALIAERSFSSLEAILGERHWYLDVSLFAQSSGNNHALGGHISLGPNSDDMTIDSLSGPVNGRFNVALGVNNVFDVRVRHDTPDVASLTRNFTLVTQE